MDFLIAFFSTLSRRMASVPVRMLRLPSRIRVAFVVVLDLVLCIVATALAYVLRIGEIYLEPAAFALTAGLALASWSLLSWRSGLYKGMARYFGSHGFQKLAVLCFYLTLVLVSVFFTVKPIGVPRTVGFILPMILLLLLATSRVIISYGLLRHVQNEEGESGASVGLRHVLIIGAGSAAREVAASMRYDPSMELVGFVDTDNLLAGRSLENRPVWSLDALESLLGERRVDSLFLASPSLARADRRTLIGRVQRVRPKLPIRILPSVRQLADERVSVSDLKEIEIEDLLGREEVRPLPHLVEPLQGARVLVTGAGGSIGAQLCLQILEARPAAIILVEMTEYHLYRIEQELGDLARAMRIEVDIVARLEDVSRPDRCRRLFMETRPERVFHAAAYKHVPLLEGNVLAGVANNVRSTLAVVEACEDVGVEQLTLVSTDKAVRPTNVMGASKRLCELIVQARAAEQSHCRMCAVRFGNVLGSSGSVVPKFKRQIAEGGPVTVTHADVTRYFMTIPEAASLVVQAGTMAEGGEVFLLHMGEPVRIVDLAHTMIELAGLSVRNAANPQGDIEIVETGLRAGEKLYEELLITADAIDTEHDRIVKAREKMVPWSVLRRDIETLERAFADGDTEAILQVLDARVDGFAARRQLADDEPTRRRA